MKSVPHNDNLPVPKPPEKWNSDKTYKETAMHQPGTDSDNVQVFELCVFGEPYLIMWSE